MPMHTHSESIHGFLVDFSTQNAYTKQRSNNMWNVTICLFIQVFPCWFIQFFCWLVGWLFCAVFVVSNNKTRTQTHTHNKFSLMSGQCVRFMNVAHIFWMQAKNPLVWLIHLPFSLTELWLRMDLKPVFNFKATHNQGYVCCPAEHILCSAERRKQQAESVIINTTKPGLCASDWRIYRYDFFFEF